MVFIVVNFDAFVERGLKGQGALCGGGRFCVVECSYVSWSIALVVVGEVGWMVCVWVVSVWAGVWSSCGSGGCHGRESQLMRLRGSSRYVSRNSG